MDHNKCLCERHAIFENIRNKLKVVYIHISELFDIMEKASFTCSEEMKLMRKYLELNPMELGEREMKCHYCGSHTAKKK
ncbi:Hypothetical protein SRAE_X000236100 [Strongyloides ratti]|uniref:Uncharacterized protein n=1 Tax=Strongyloides ratti TaxID=34506 RepID=A0A090KT87_STRRB|nr:Hypothetical protein SRAE_X000236100 [Strongyloides ratti]CEF60626.1 Hypothetical protein SRAE_X000236100 [Strongyloides ratti]